MVFKRTKISTIDFDATFHGWKQIYMNIVASKEQLFFSELGLAVRFTEDKIIYFHLMKGEMSFAKVQTKKSQLYLA